MDIVKQLQQHWHLWDTVYRRNNLRLPYTDCQRLSLKDCLVALVSTLPAWLFMDLDVIILCLCRHLHQFGCFTWVLSDSKRIQNTKCRIETIKHIFEDYFHLGENIQHKGNNWHYFRLIIFSSNCQIDLKCEDDIHHGRSERPSATREFVLPLRSVVGSGRHQALSGVPTGRDQVHLNRDVSLSLGLWQMWVMADWEHCQNYFVIVWDVGRNYLQPSTSQHGYW